MTSLDMILTGGPIWTGTRHVDAVGVRDGRVKAAGTLEDVESAVDGGATVVDLDGRRAIPGLIDSHIHVVRAGLSWNQTVRWDDVDSLESGLDRIRKSAGSRPSGSWIRVLGGWHPGVFPEGRGPTKSELDEAGGDHPVYVQLLYEEGTLNGEGLRLLRESGWNDGVDLDDDGEPTGRISGAGAFRAVLSLFEKSSRIDSIDGTTTLMTDLAALGVTGVIDPGGFGITPSSYDALFRLWQDEKLPLRVRLYLVPSAAESEMDDVREWVRYVRPGFGDDLLRYTGMGEILSFGCHDMEGVEPFTVDDDARALLFEISQHLAVHDWPIHLHAILDSTISSVLDVWEEIDRRHGLPGRRWSLAHAEPIGQENLARVQHLGVGLAIQNRMMFRSADSAAIWGEEVAANAPPLGDIIEKGIPLGAGTDSTVVSPHNPWPALWWLVTGRSHDGAPPRDLRHQLSVEQALTAYTRGSAWFSFEEQSRGHLEPGAHADIAVLDTDPFQIDPEDLPTIKSDLTLVGGKPVHIGRPFSGI